MSRFCRDCIHSTDVYRTGKRGTPVSWVGCKLFERTPDNVSLVTGKSKTPPYFVNCEYLRSRNGACGIEGKLFQAAADSP